MDCEACGTAPRRTGMYGKIKWREHPASHPTLHQFLELSLNHKPLAGDLRSETL